MPGQAPPRQTAPVSMRHVTMTHPAQNFRNPEVVDDAPLRRVIFRLPIGQPIATVATTTMLKLKSFALRAPFFVCFFAFTVLTASGQSPTIGTCPVFPADNIWNTPIDQLPVSSNSAT